MIRTVHCAKLNETLPGLSYVPLKGPLGQRIYDSISEKAWKSWVSHSTLVINEYRLNPSEIEAQNILKAQMEAFLFGDGVAAPAGYKAPAKA